MEPSVKTALLVMDMQSSVLSNHANAPTLVANVSKAIAHARQHSIPVIFIAVSFRAGLPEVSANNKGFSTFLQKEQWTPEFATEHVKIHPGLAVQPADIMVVKRRVSAFTGSDLEVILRSNNIQHLVLTGYATSGVVLSTLREAADKDYQLTVLEDCCNDWDEEVHRVLTTKVFVWQADVLPLAQWLQ
ncbi:Nicotinamidase-related amidase [Chitinophaga costaii]|uniref:Nicotinamidase-related amidase n=1 Tax=Chitinophaga costaii TaxID=1335309 RepID=A0A1C4CV09_9BACT|nr:isochorismatase family cysteine hydrolase [Chitinophaga costaii]PUZ26935.1 cysteine hydrolase [Chitinophaga costaii]SCC22897.1 Nicotinamidase-related amidase [Chitinophaga costaii]